MPKKFIPCLDANKKSGEHTHVNWIRVSEIWRVDPMEARVIFNGTEASMESMVFVKDKVYITSYSIEEIQEL